MAEYSVLVDLRGMQAPLLRTLQRLIDLISFGLAAAADASESELRLPDTYFHVAPAQDAALNFAEAQREFSPFLLACGLRETVEAFGGFLEEVRSVCAI